MATKCRSIVGIWSQSPPSHRVTAVAVIDEPPSLYTAASDGSIVWWHLSSDLSSPKIKPVAILCGHVAPVAGLCISYPLLSSLVEKADQDRSAGINNQAALVSVCSDGVVCVWSRGSGHCRCRRKLPSWVGNPSIVQTLPTNKRYICLVSSFTDISHASDTEYADSTEGGEVTADEEYLRGKAPKCSVIIVDSYSLDIVQTVFHGHLPIGPLKFMALVQPVDDNQKHNAFMFDSFGKCQCIPLIKDCSVDNDGAKVHQSSLLSTPTSNSEPYLGLVLSVATCGQLLGLVYKTRCMFLRADSAAIIGFISAGDDGNHGGANCILSRFSGGMFISSSDTSTSESIKPPDTTGVKFSVWDDRGAAIIYELLFVDGIFKYEVISEIAAITCPMYVILSAWFVQLRHYFLRIESICFSNDEPALWRPHVSIWSLNQQLDDHENLGKSCRLLGVGDFLVNWIDGSSHASNSGAWEQDSREKPAAMADPLTLRPSTLPQEVAITLYKDDSNFISVWKESTVSSTMVISFNAQTPYGIVYGYHGGQLELVQFNLLAQKVECDGVHLHLEPDSQGSKRHFLGHTGPVLCLAAHKMAGTSTERTWNKVLLSGSMDCTLRVWDLETCSAIMVMHHHVAPVRQIILPPLQSHSPWNDCFLSVGEDSCVALVSLNTLRVERMFPGHPSYPLQVVWDGMRGYLACLSQNQSGASGTKEALYIWDIKAGSRERVLRNAAALSMFNNFCKGMGINSINEHASLYNTSRSPLTFSMTEDRSSLPSNLENSVPFISSESKIKEQRLSSLNSNDNYLKVSTGSHDKLPIRCSCPISGIAILNFNLLALLSPDLCESGEGNHWNSLLNEPHALSCSQQDTIPNDSSEQEKFQDEEKNNQCIYRACLLQFSLSFLHLWDVDPELDHLLMTDMNVKRYENMVSAPGLEGDGGSITLAFPAYSSALQLWKSSSEFCAIRSLTMVSLAQSLVSLCHSCSGASSALSGFYTRNFAEKVPDVKPPSLQLLVSFWEDEDEHVRLAARSLFHCVASRAIPPPLCHSRATEHAKPVNFADQVIRSELKKEKETDSTLSYVPGESSSETQGDSHVREGGILKWLESHELQDWISCVGGTSQDAMASHIVVASALAVWFPSLVKSSLAKLVVHPLIKLVMAMNEKFSCTAAELLAEGMETTWKACIDAEIHGLIGDIFFQIECLTGASSNSSSGAAVPPKLRETLVSILLPSLALADIPGFLSVVEGLIWSTASDSPVHLVSLMTLIRLMRGSPRILAQYLIKMVNFILQTMDPANSVMRRTCLQSAMATLKEVVRVYPMIALNDTSTRLAVGDAVAEVNHAQIHVYDMQSVTKTKVLDASGPRGIPTLISGTHETVISAISTLTFSPDGEGLVAFSEHGLIIRWWSLGTGWWDKLSRSLIPLQCTKLIFVPPWEGFSPNSSRASIMENIAGNSRAANSQVHTRSSDMDSLNLLLFNLDLSYQLDWVGDRKVRLTRHGQELGTFPL